MAVPMIFVRGTNREVGHQIGQTFKSRIQDTVDLQLLRAHDTPKGRAMYNAYLNTCKAVYPHYIEELQGIADGAEVPFEYLFFSCIGSEITALSGDHPFKDSLEKNHEGCTDLILTSDEQAIIAHSEDVTPDITNGYIIQAHILPSTSNPREEKFTAFSYPGTLPGNTFGINAHGLIFTGNMIFQKGITSHNSIPRRFITRAFLSAQSLEDVINIIKKPPGTASAYNANVGVKEQSGNRAKFYSVEIGHSVSGSIVDVHQYVDGFSYHLNHFNRLGIDHYTDDSSVHRAARIQQLPTPANMHDILEIMSDTHDEKYPIYRNGAPPDVYATSGIGVFDLKKNTLSVYMDNPKKNNFEPGAVIGLQGDVPNVLCF
ncbi:beta-alanyl-dopamine/carcinine hydrolase-like [Glandiceps talaboti]